MRDTWNALADPSRRKILQLLRKQDMSAGEIAAYFEISKPSLSHHLSILKQAGLVDSQKQGQNIIYSINTTVLQDVIGFIGELKGGQDNDKK